jgi:hypothetical protein
VSTNGFAPSLFRLFAILAEHGAETIRSSTHWKGQFTYIDAVKNSLQQPRIRVEEDPLYLPLPLHVLEALTTIRAVFPRSSAEPGIRLVNRLRPISGVNTVETPKTTVFVGPGDQTVPKGPEGWHKKAIHWSGSLPLKVECIAVLDNGCYHLDEVAYHRNSKIPAALHGTQVAAVILDLLPEASLQAWKVTEGDSGFIDKPLIVSDSTEYLTALRDVRQPGSKVRVVNISRGQQDWTMIEKEEMEHLEAAGILVVAAAGNVESAGAHHVDFPAALPTVLSVGAVQYEAGDRGFAIWERSRHGFNLKQMKCVSRKLTAVDLVAPGVAIQVPKMKEPLSGTSFAAPMVSALAGLLLTLRPALKPADVRTIIRSSCTPCPDGAHEEYGRGLLHWEKALTLLGNDPGATDRPQ